MSFDAENVGNTDLAYVGLCNMNYLRRGWGGEVARVQKRQSSRLANRDSRPTWLYFHFRHLHVTHITTEH
jgi:hypothetical protein